MAAEKPILFSGPMVRAILAGRKTVTRRVYKPRRPPPYEDVDEGDDGAPRPFEMDEYGDYHHRRSPFGEPGDRLWVREAWCNLALEGHAPVYAYRADGELTLPPGVQWKPSIHMPRAASRLTLEVKSVRIERLQDITEQDALSEGVEANPYYMADGTVDDMMSIPARANFASLWDSIDGKKHPWTSNPWVWVVSFEVANGS